MTTNSNSYRSLSSENITLISSAHLEVQGMIDRSFLSGNHADAITGTTDSMILPRALAVVDVEPSPSILEIPESTQINANWGAGLSLLGLVACCALLFHQISQKKRSSDRVVETKKFLPIDLPFFLTRSLPAIPEESRDQHDRALTNANLLAEKVLELDSERFREDDFISFVRLKYGIQHPADKYRDLDRPIQRLDLALRIRKLYRVIERIESTYTEPKLQELYRFVAYLLAECPEREMFRCLLREKIENSLELRVFERDELPLFEYFQAIETIVSDHFGFTLLGLFKNHRSNHLFTLTLISDLLDRLELSEENTERTLADFVYQHEGSLVQLHASLAIDEGENYLKNFVKILQYLVLERRYRPSLDKFERSVALLGEWYLSYQIVIGIRQEYPPTDYRQPKNFSEAIPGLALYQTYENSLNQPSMVF